MYNELKTLGLHDAEPLILIILTLALPKNL